MKPDKRYTIGCWSAAMTLSSQIGIIPSPLYKDRKGWPDAEILPDRSSVCAEDLEIETAW
jgi:hypothetical protein